MTQQRKVVELAINRAELPEIIRENGIEYVSKDAYYGELPITFRILPVDTPTDQHLPSTFEDLHARFDDLYRTQQTIGRYVEKEVQKRVEEFREYIRATNPIAQTNPAITNNQRLMNERIHAVCPMKQGTFWMTHTTNRYGEKKPQLWVITTSDGHWYNQRTVPLSTSNMLKQARRVTLRGQLGDDTRTFTLDELVNGSRYVGKPELVDKTHPKYGRAIERAFAKFIASIVSREGEVVSSRDFNNKL